METRTESNSIRRMKFTMDAYYCIQTLRNHNIKMKLY